MTAPTAMPTMPQTMVIVANCRTTLSLYSSRRAGAPVVAAVSVAVMRIPEVGDRKIFGRRGRARNTRHTAQTVARVSSLTDACEPPHDRGGTRGQRTLGREHERPRQRRGAQQEADRHGD